MDIHKLIEQRVSDMSILKYTSCFTVLFIVGCFVNKLQPFPDYYFYSIIFEGIFITAVIAEKFYLLHYKKMMGLIGSHKEFHKVKHRYFMDMHSKKNLVIPSICSILFTILGLLIYSTKKITVTLFIILLFFSVDIFVSMIGYMQYFYLFKFVYSLKKIDIVKTRRYNNIYPAKTAWIEKLSYMCKIYQYVFFSLGSAYIIAFSRLCLNPAFGVNLAINNVILIIEWGIISLLIIVFFPIATFCEYFIISHIVKKLKQESLRILEIEHRHSSDVMKIQLSTLMINIIETKNYPLNNTLSNIYSGISSFVNALTAGITILNLYGISNESISKFLF